MYICIYIYTIANVSTGGAGLDGPFGVERGDQPRRDDQRGYIIIIWIYIILRRSAAARRSACLQAIIIVWIYIHTKAISRGETISVPAGWAAKRK